MDLKEKWKAKAFRYHCYDEDVAEVFRPPLKEKVQKFKGENVVRLAFGGIRLALVREEW